MLAYIHIPFCDSKCAYCAFNSYVDKFELKERYMAVLYRQLENELHRFGATKGSLKTLFIGGGTPSTVAPKLYEPLFSLLAPYLGEDAEITSEANPNSATDEWLLGMRTLGVNRISFGVQSFDDEKLRLLRRAHSAKQATAAVENAQKAGFGHISLDLIYGVAGDSDELLQNDLKQAFSLPIDHISAYALTIEEKTPFARTPQMASERLESTRRLFQSIESHGFKQYEISNFGSYRSRHNLGYWRLENYIGAGSGAVGFQDNARLYPQSDIERYIAESLAVHTEHLSEEDIKLERLFLGLRSIVGVEDAILNTKERERAELLVNEQKLTCKEGVYYNNDYLLSDELALFITT